METKLARIAEISRSKKDEKFTSLYHLLSKQMLLQCHKELDGNKAVGVDGITKEEYAKELDDNLGILVEKLKKKAYVPKPVRRVYIPKGDGKETRPLGIPSYEDKVVQLAVKKILEAIFEQVFLECSYGFRRELGCHDALKELGRIIETQKVSFVVDADIKGFFSNVDHEWLMKCVQEKVADPNLLRLIKRFLKSGIMENGEFEASENGTPQGAIISPILANIYLHYVLDLWFEKAVKPKLRGEGYLVRFADDFVCGFQYKSDADNFYANLKLRLKKFGLEIAENKSKVLEFGRFAEETREEKGKGKPGTFDFLGFTHHCGNSGRGKGYFKVRRKTSKKKFKAKVKEMKMWIKKNRHMDIATMFRKLADKLRGHYNYFGIVNNMNSMNCYYRIVTMLVIKWLNRRSQKKSFTFDKFNLYLALNPLPKPKVHIWI